MRQAQRVRTHSRPKSTHLRTTVVGMGACSLPAESNPPVHTNHPHFPISCNGTPISCNETCTSCAEICQSATSIATGCFGLQARFVCFGLCHICPRIAVKRKIDLYRTGDQTPLHPGRNFLETRVIRLYARIEMPNFLVNSAAGIHPPERVS